PHSIELANRAAEGFVKVYYAAYDSKNRLADMPQFYRPSSSLVWNGTAFRGPDGLRDLLSRMPPTTHDVQSHDCQPVPNTSPPQLLVTVTGQVTHGKGPEGNPKHVRPKEIEGHPRVFHQTFMLVADPEAPVVKPGEVANNCARPWFCRFLFHLAFPSLCYCSNYPPAD
ncbi:NTF2-like protein, partial [Fistulina hepatica ATCC 64428]